MATFDSIFPTFLAKCGELHTLLLSVAFALFIVGVIVTVKQHPSHKSVLNLLLRVFILTSLLVFLPAWGNTLQNLLQTSILSGLGVDPANVYQQFNQLLIIKRDPATTSSWWNVMSQLHNFTTDLIISAVLWLVGQLADKYPQPMKRKLPTPEEGRQSTEPFRHLMKALQLSVKPS